ncbi:hypothetical protein I6765_02645 [Helicobacter pylori]|uniref:hypothetical protein n=1 Tax=Helicobacter pylori TaxID=210 RepID=UPI0018D0C2C6|nr:hypothetical protein [Helicobacter pylori]MBH0268970.1 hypothetical protein [Helicobacter pylori]
MRVKLKTFDSLYLVSVEEGRLKYVSTLGLRPVKWISACGGDPHVRTWREAVIFGTEENKKKITTILRKFKGSKFEFYICGSENGYKDSVIFNFHFDWKKETQDWYSIDFKDFSEILLTLESKVRELRQKHEAKVESEKKKKEEEGEMIKQEVKKARDFIILEREKGNDEIIAFSAKLKDFVMEIAKRDGVEIEQIEKAVNFLSLSYYYGYKDINKSRVAGDWIFLEACETTPC